MSYEKLDELGSIQWPCNDAGARRHADDARRRVRARQGQVLRHGVRADRRARRRAGIPLLLTTGRILTQYNVGAQTRRTAERRRGTTRTCSRSIRTTPRTRGINDGDWVGVASRAGETVLRADGHRARAAGRRLHDLPLPRVRAPTSITTENSDWATNCPEYKVTAVQVMPVFHPSEWQSRFKQFTKEQLSLLDARERA